MGQINSLGPRPMLDLISGMGGWDVLGTWSEATWDFNELLYRIQGIQSASVFFSMSIVLDRQNVSKNLIRVNYLRSLLSNNYLSPVNAHRLLK